MYTRICPLCGKEFQTKRHNRIYCYNVHYRKCVICGKDFVITTKDGPMTCSKDCATKWKVQNRKSVTKVCKICGQLFTTKQSSQTICNRNHTKTCSICGKEFSIDSNNYFQITCSKECAQVRRERTNMSKYGVSNVSKSDEIKQKKVQTFLNRYGHASPFQSEEIQDEIKETLINRYGVDNALKSKEIRDKVSKTNLEKYGAENVFQSEEIKSKIQDTMIERYGGIGFGSSELSRRAKVTMIEKYGAPTALESVELRQKIENTMVKRYGVKSYLQSDEGKTKVKRTMVERYGAENIMQSAEGVSRYKQSCLDKYGVEWAIGSDIIQNKICEINQQKYGVNYPFQSEDIQQLIRQSFIEIYGYSNPLMVDEIRDKIHQTVMQRYGVDYSLQSPIIRERIKQTNLQKYGVSNPFRSDEIKEKIKKSNLEKYGVDHYSKTEEFKQKRRKTVRSKFGGPSPFASEEIMQKSMDACMEKYGVPYPCLTPQCRKAYNTISKINLSFVKLLDDLGIEYDMEFPIDKKAYDIKIGSILIEINPTITHNSYMNIFDKNSNGYLSNYHRSKSELAIENGYRCIHVWDWDDWSDILSLISYNQKIFARNCVVRKITKDDAVGFTSENHISGSCRGQDFCYGLFYNDQLIEVMTFGRPRYNRNYQFELLRLCTKQGYQVVGGASKLFRKFISEENPQDIISYCDLSKFDGKVYSVLGMKLKRYTEPNKIWSRGHEYVTANLLRQRGYDQLFGTNYGKGTDNEQLMLNDGWLPVYDCGQAVYEWKRLP